MRFTDKVALVTGAAGGIGLATARRLAAEGARVVIVDLDADKANAAARLINASGAPTCYAATCDVAQEAQVISTVQEVIKRCGQLNVVVNNAGLMIFKPIEAHTEADWLRILHVDLLGAFFFIKQAFLTMQAGGAIVNVSSIHAEQTTPQVASYAAAKAALLSLTRSAAIEGKPKGIRVNAVLPGAIDTPMLWENPNVKSGLETIDAAAVGKPEDVAAGIAYLASDDARFVQGIAMRIDGGRLIQL